MPARKPPVLFLDPEMDDPDTTLAMRYMHREIERELAKSSFKGKPPPEIGALIELRYGLPPDSIERKPNQPLEDALKEAFRRIREPDIAEPEGFIYVLRWDQKSAVHWFRTRLDALWPKEAQPFLAADPVTLWTACLAMEYAPSREHQIQDDPFRAPPLLIRGPTGTGKELIALAIHLAEANDERAFGAINCGGLSPDLLESELFGHKRGAFTGATSDKKGFVEEYQTVFLDEVGDMPMAIQVRLLRFLNTSEFRRVGDNEIRHAKKLRIISATHVALEEQIEAGQFREDLYHRLRGRTLRLRALHERKDSIPALIKEFLQREASVRSIDLPTLTTEAQIACQEYQWPGNMREMKYVVEYVLDRIDSRHPIGLDDLPDEIHRHYRAHVPPLMQTAFELASYRERSETPQAQRLKAAYVLRRQIQQSPSPSAEIYERIASLIGKIGEALHLDEQLAPQCKRLSHLADIERIQHVRTQWLAPLVEQASAFSDEVQGVLSSVQKEIEQKLKQLEASARALDDQADAASAQYAVAAFVRLVMPLLQAFNSKVLIELESMTSALMKPPLAGGSKWFGQQLRDRTPQQIKALVEEAFVEVSADQVIETPALRWAQVKDDAGTLQQLRDKTKTDAELARYLQIEPATLSRAVRRLQLPPRRQNKKR
jgi:DNA-binding NtrC family response regulator